MLEDTHFFDKNYLIDSRPVLTSKFGMSNRPSRKNSEKLQIVIAFFLRKILEQVVKHWSHFSPFSLLLIFLTILGISFFFFRIFLISISSHQQLFPYRICILPLSHWTTSPAECRKFFTTSPNASFHPISCRT